MFMVECPSCHAKGFTEDGNALDAAVVCGCCTEHADHAAHVAAVQATGSAECRPVNIMVLPGSVAMKAD